MTDDTAPDEGSGRGTGRSSVVTFLERPPTWVARPVRWMTVLELALGVVALLLIFSLVLMQALQRYLPIDGWSFTGELARFSLVWLTFLVAGVLVTTDSHIAIEVVDSVPSPLVRRVVRVLSCLIVAAVGVGLVNEAWALVETQGVISSPAMGMPMSWLYGIPLIGFVSIVVRASVAAVRYAVLGVPERDYGGLGDPGSLGGEEVATP